MFQPVHIEWKGETFTVESGKVMGLIAAIEDVLPLTELMTKASEQRLPLSKIAIAYATALRYAGAKVTDETVYHSLFSDGMAEQAPILISGLVSMMIPPDAMKRMSAESAEGNAAAATLAAASPKQRTKRSSATVM